MVADMGRDISGDGSVIVGDGVNPEGKTEPWRAVLSSPVQTR